MTALSVNKLIFNVRVLYQEMQEISGILIAL